MEPHGLECTGGTHTKLEKWERLTTVWSHLSMLNKQWNVYYQVRTNS